MLATFVPAEHIRLKGDWRSLPASSWAVLHSPFLARVPAPSPPAPSSYLASFAAGAVEALDQITVSMRSMEAATSSQMAASSSRIDDMTVGVHDQLVYVQALRANFDDRISQFSDSILHLQARNRALQAQLDAQK